MICNRIKIKCTFESPCYTNFYVICIAVINDDQLYIEQGVRHDFDGPLYFNWKHLAFAKANLPESYYRGPKNMHEHGKM